MFPDESSELIELRTASSCKHFSLGLVNAIPIVASRIYVMATLVVGVRFARIVAPVRLCVMSAPVIATRGGTMRRRRVRGPRLVPRAGHEAHRDQHPQRYGRTAKAEPRSGSTLQFRLVAGFGESIGLGDHPIRAIRERSGTLASDVICQCL